MLLDTARTGAYERAIAEHAHLFAGKTVLDVGCGTGVLAMFAARAGAKRVVGIDNSAMISHAEKAVAANGYADVITLVRGKLEDTIKAGTLGLAEGEVDVIVSEWMGYGLLYESMLPSVLCARDALLAADGTMYPDVAELFVEAVDDSGRPLAWWRDVSSQRARRAQRARPRSARAQRRARVRRSTGSISRASSRSSSRALVRRTSISSSRARF